MTRRVDLAFLLERLGKRVRWRDVRRGQALFREGDASTAMYAVGHGRVRLARRVEGAGEVVQHVARAGNTLAEAALFADRYHCDAIAEVASRIAVIPRDALLQGFERDPELLRGFLGLLAAQVRDARSRLQLRSVRPARARVWQYLLLRALGDRVTLDRPAREIAGELGLTPEAVYRALSALRSEGRIHGRGKKLRLVPRGKRKT